MTVLKPCPFCGGEAYYRRPQDAGNFEIWSVECRHCGASPYAVQIYRGQTMEHKRATIARFWNRRANGEKET